jgi:hypothetical protein
MFRMLLSSRFLSGWPSNKVKSSFFLKFSMSRPIKYVSIRCTFQVHRYDVMTKIHVIRSNVNNVLKAHTQWS